MRRRLIVAATLACGLLAAPAHAGDSCAPSNVATLQGWQGVWIAENMEIGINGRDVPGKSFIISVMKFIGQNAPWNDEGWRRFEERISPGLFGTLKNHGWGFPMMMSSPAPFTFVIAPWETAIISQYREIRHVYTDGRSHPAEEDRWPNEWGDSIGCWDGDTLTIETTNVKYSPNFNFLSPPISEQAHFIERLRLASPGRIESDVTVIDPETLEEPWRLKLAYVRHASVERLVHAGDTFDNDRTSVEGDKLSIAPPREAASVGKPERPDFELTDGAMDRLVGSYKFVGSPFTMKVERRRKRLLFHVDPVQPFLIPLHADGPHDFFVRGMSTRFHFTSAATGEVTGISGVGPDGVPFTAKREN